MGRKMISKEAKCCGVVRELRKRKEKRRKGKVEKTWMCSFRKRREVAPEEMEKKRQKNMRR